MKNSNFEESHIALQHGKRLWNGKWRERKRVFGALAIRAENYFQTGFLKFALPLFMLFESSRFCSIVLFFRRKKSPFAVTRNFKNILQIQLRSDSRNDRRKKCRNFMIVDISSRKNCFIKAFSCIHRSTQHAVSYISFQEMKSPIVTSRMDS